ncbi:hypothetical protein ACXDTG_000441 [Klebsiella pneumoniae]
MTKSTITREQLEEWVAQFNEDGGCDATDRQLETLIRQSLAAMDGEPVAEVVSIYGDPEAFGEREIRPLVGIQQMPYGTKLYRHAQPAPVVSAELLHTAASAIEDLLTTKDRTGAFVWFDLPFRLRSAANAQPVTVVPDEVTAEDCPALVKYDVTEVDEAWARGFNACRAAMLDNCATVESRNNAGCSPKNGLKCATVLQAEPVTTANKLGNSPVIPDGYVMVPKEVTQEIGNAINVVGNRCTCGNCSQRLWDFLLAAAPQEVKGES